MKKSLFGLLILSLIGYACSQGEDQNVNRWDSATLDSLFETFSSFDLGDDEQLINQINEAVKGAQNDEPLRRDLESRLIALLESDATLASKKYTCQKLTVIGSVDSVPSLVKYLNDPEVAHWARLALERIPDSAVDTALRTALGTVSSDLKTGLIYCLANRKDTQAVDALLPLTEDSDPATAVASVFALGKIGGLEAGEALLDRISETTGELHPDILDAQLRAGEALIENGKTQEAIKIYRSLFANRRAEHVRMAGYIGLLNVQPENARDLLEQGLTGDNDKMRGIAAQYISENSPAKDIRYFVNSLGNLSPDGQVSLMDALSSLNEDTAAPAVRELVNSGEESVRIAAFTALGKIGDSSDVELLAEAAATRSGAEGEAALESLVDMEVEEVDQRLIANLEMATAEVRVVLINSLMMRMAFDADEAIIGLLDDPDENVRAAVIDSAAKIGNETHIPVLVEFIKRTEDTKEQAGVEKALRSICGRTGEKSSKYILAAYENAGKALRLRLVDQFNLVGSQELLEVLRSLVTDDGEEIQSVAIRTISNWPTEEVLEDLKQIADESDNLTHSVLAFRGYIRLVRSLNEPDADKVGRLLEAYSSLVRRPDEANLIFAALGSMRGSIEALEAVRRFLDESEYTEEAIAALLNIANTMDNKYKADIELALNKVRQKTEDADIIERVDRIAGKYGIRN